VREVLRQRRWLGFTVFIAAMIGLCAVLAHWQWTRYQERSAENRRLDAALAAPAVPIDEAISPVAAGTDQPVPADLEWRAITATGRFDPAAEVAVRRRPLDGRTGFWVVTPLVTEHGVLLVNRGWAPAGRDATAAPDVPPPPPGTVTVTGRLRAAEEATQRDAPPPGQAWAVDPDVLLPPGSGERFDAYVEMRQAQPPADEGLTVLADPGHRGLNNLVYTVQWLIFALVGAFGWWRLIRQESRREVEPVDGDPHLASDPSASEQPRPAPVTGDTQLEA
jgi:cytochrome oxidase assembly protein ShyY1